MFQSARLKLTLWYVVISMIVSVVFSVVLFEVFTRDLARDIRIESRRRYFPPNPMYVQELVAAQEQIEARVRLQLIYTNLIIMGLSAVVGYFLAGRSLKPIKIMLDEQNQFITDASHELRTPLTSLKSEIEVNLRDKKLTLDDTKKLLQSNLEEVNNLQILSDSLIKLTQYQKGNNSLIIQNVSLSKISDEAIKKVARLAKNKKITIVKKVDGETTEGSKQELTELLIILLDNAIKYSPQKTIVTLTSEKNDGFVNIKIMDQGVGIDKEDIPHLFDRFFRSDKSRTKSYVSGYGLGLAIAKEIVERHNGEISVESKLNEGTIFTVKLPFKHSTRLT